MRRVLPSAERKGSKLRACKTSRPVFTCPLRKGYRRCELMTSLYPVMRSKRSFCCSETLSFSAAATAVAVRVRMETIAPVPPVGWTALERIMTKELVVGSIHNDVPVNPVWPKEPMGRRSPRLEEKGESMSHPKARTEARVGGVCGVIIFSTVSDDSTGAPPFNIACAYLATSSAVEKSPA